jgi:LysM repeat protein
MATTAPPDEVDQVLKQYITPAVTAEPQHNFAADLNPIPAEPIEQPRVKEVTVKKGDVLERIARQNRVSVSELMKFNNLTGTRLKIGQVLKIPAKAQKAISETTAGAEYYTVKNGDNPWVIAVRHHMKVEELLQLNNMDEAKARRLKPGDRIRIK